jgi:hypothetical protein
MATSDLPGPAHPIFENEQRIFSADGRQVLRLGESNIVWIRKLWRGDAGKLKKVRLREI